MKEVTVLPNCTLKQALKKLNKTGTKSLVVADKNKTLLGTLSDGDVRKSILKGIKINSIIEKIYNKNPKYFKIGEFSNEECKKIFLTEKYDLIPVVDDYKNNKIVDIIFWDKILGKNNSKIEKKLTASVVIMAGGIGARLEPFTKVLPKPLVPINDKPVIEHIIDRFRKIGCKKFFLTVNYKAKILKAYFDELSPDYYIKFIKESEPLGTAGSLRYLEDYVRKPFFVTNCDVIIKADYRSIHSYHLKQKNDITLVASTKEYAIPYGTCEINSEGHLSRIIEKPKHNYLVNTGLYVINPDVLLNIPKGKFLHITDLIENTLSEGKKVGVYPVDDDSWLDIGHWSEYQKVVKLLNIEKV